MKHTRFVYQLSFFLFILFTILTVRTVSASLLLENGYDSYQIQTLLNLGANLVLIAFSYFLIRKNRLEKLAGLKDTKLQRWYLLLFPLLYLVLLNLLLDGQVGNPTIMNLVLALIYFISVGFAEELSVRGFMQSYFISHLGNSKKSIFLSVIISALFFGFVHIIKFDMGIYGELSQVLYATFIGAMFGAVLLATRKLYPLVIIHAVIDVVGNMNKIGLPLKEIKEPWDLESAIIVIALTLPCLIYAIFILRKYRINLDLKTTKRNHVYSA